MTGSCFQVWLKEVQIKDLKNRQAAGKNVLISVVKCKLGGSKYRRHYWYRSENTIISLHSYEMPAEWPKEATATAVGGGGHFPALDPTLSVTGHRT